MLKFIQSIAAAAALFMLTACGGTAPLDLFDRATAGAGNLPGQTLDAAASSIDKYCIVPELARAGLRTAINSRTRIGDVRVTCAGDLDGGSG